MRQLAMSMDGGTAPRGGTARPASRAAKDPWRDVLRDVLGPAPLRVLDLGSDAGDAALALDELGHFAHGVDKDPEAVRRARRRAAERCAAAEFRVGDAENLEFPARTFDAVHARDLLAHLAHPDWALAEWFRVLRPGGLVIVTGEGGPAAAAGALASAGFWRVATREVDAPVAARGSFWRGLVRRAAVRSFAAWGIRA